MFDAKTSHMGGPHILSDRALDAVLKKRAELIHMTGEESLAETSSIEPHRCSDTIGSVDTSTTSLTVQGGRLAVLLSPPSTTIPSPQAIKMDIFNLLLQPAFEFHVMSQTYARRIGSQDRHHRSQDTGEDSFEIMEYCRKLENELQELWKQRPSILNLTTDLLIGFVCRDIALKLEQLFSVYLATFWSHFIYIHRVAYWNFKHSTIASKAVEETGRMLHRCVNGASNELQTSIVADNIDRLQRTIHPGLMWTCFLFGCETPEPAQQEWAVKQLARLGQRRQVGKVDQSNNDGQIDERTLKTASRVSALLKVLIERQSSSGCRVDGKYLCEELFGCHFYVV